MAIGRRDDIILREKKSATAKLVLKGPTSLDEGRDFAVALNKVIAEYNTRWFVREDGTKIEPRITAETSKPS